ncbi:MAG: hypothetical protein FWC79_00185 [Oscillospiraceae bacterium]|nr:hypothetical protein [Oscillospiraceae bacterium]
MLIYQNQAASKEPILVSKFPEHFMEFGDEDAELMDAFYRRDLSFEDIYLHRESFRGKRFVERLAGSNFNERYYGSNHEEKEPYTEEDIMYLFDTFPDITEELMQKRREMKLILTGLSKAKPSDKVKEAISSMYGVQHIGTSDLTLKELASWSEYASKESILNRYSELWYFKDIDLTKYSDVDNVTIGDLRKTHSMSLQEIKELGEALGDYELIRDNIGENIRVYGIDNILKLNEDTNGLFEDVLKTYNLNKRDGKTEYSYEEFEDVFVQIVMGISRKETRYEKVTGPFRERQPEIFLSDKAPEKLKENYYAQTLTPELLIANPDWAKHLKDVKLAMGFSKVRAETNRTNADLYMYLEEHFGREKALQFILENNIGNFGENSHNGRSVKIDIEPSYEEAIKSMYQYKYESILAGQSRNYEKLPQKFKEAYPDIFLPNDRPDELAAKYYGQAMTPELIAKNPEWIGYLKKCNLRSGFIGAGITVMNGKRQTFYEHMEEKFGRDKLFEFMIENHAIIYATPDITINGTDKETYSEIIEKIDERAYKAFAHGVKEIEGVPPERFTLKYPEIVLSEDIPQEFREKYYRKTLKLEDIDDLLDEFPELLEELQEKNIAAGIKYLANSSKVFTTKELLDYIQADSEGLEALLVHYNDSSVRAGELKEKLDRYSKFFAMQEMKEKGYTDEEIEANLDKVIEQKKRRIIENPGVIMYFPEDQLEGFDFREYEDLTSSNAFIKSENYRRGMEEKFISKMYASLGFASTMEILRIPNISEEELEYIIWRHKEQYEEVYKETYKLTGNIKVISTLFNKYDLSYIKGKKSAKMDVYKMMNEMLQEGSVDSLEELLNGAIEQNEFEANRDKNGQLAKTLIANHTIEKMNSVEADLRSLVNREITEGAAEKKVIFDTIYLAMRKSLNAKECIDIEVIEQHIKGEFNRTREDGEMYYSPHITSHKEDMMRILEELNKEENHNSILNSSVVDILREEQSKIGQGWMRKLMNIPENLSKEQIEVLMGKIDPAGERGIPADRIVALKDNSILGRKNAYELLKQIENPEILTYEKAEIMFDNLTPPYSEEFVKYFMKHRKEIMSSPEYYTKYARMNANFDSIVSDVNIINRYNAGIYTVAELVDELNNIRYDNVQEGEHELEYRARKAGLDKRYFETAKRLKQTLDEREYQTIPPAEVQAKNFRGRMLRIDDPLHIVVGDITTCCQALRRSDCGRSINGTCCY